MSGSYITSFVPTVQAAPTWNLNALVLQSFVWGPVAQYVKTPNLQAGVDWKVGNHEFRVNYNSRRRLATALESNVRVDFGAGATGEATSTTGSPAGVGSVGQTSSWRTVLSDVKMFTLNHRFSNGDWKVSTKASYSASDAGVGTAPNSFFNVTGTLPNLVITATGLTGSGDDLKSILPTQYSYSDRSGRRINGLDGNLYTLSQASVTDRRSKRINKELGADVSRSLNTAVPITLKLGTMYSIQEYNPENHNTTYAFRPGTGVSARLASNYDVIDQNYSQQVVPFVDGNRVQWVSPVKLYGLYRSNPEYFALDRVAQHRSMVNGTKRLREDVFAGYVRGDIHLIQGRLKIATGVRFEKTKDDGRGPLNDPSALFVKNANGNFVLDAAGKRTLVTTDTLEQDKLQYKMLGAAAKRSYSDFYPSLNASYALNDRVLLRAGYAKTLSRPNLSFIIPGVTFSPVDADPQTISVVNSGLKPWTANNYDLTLETYLAKGGSGSVSVFRKDINDFFTTVEYQATPEFFASYGIQAMSGVDYIVRSRANGGDAQIDGFEFSYRQSLLFLPNWARGFQGFLTYTKLRLGGSSTADFTGFNPETLAWGVNFIRSRFLAKFSMTMQGETRRSLVGSSATIPAGTYMWQQPKRRAFLTLEYQLSKNLSIFGSVDDVLTRKFYDGLHRYADPSTPVYARWQRLQDWGQTIRFGVKGTY